MRYLQLFLGCLIVNIGVFILHSAHIGTGGSIGLALSISYWIDIAFPFAYVIVNIPFFILSIKKLGLQFTLSTVLAIAILSILSYITELIMPEISIPTWIGVILGSVIVGCGVILLFLNKSSLGGTSIVSLYLQRKFQWDPGKTLFIFDLFIILTTCYSIGWIGFIYSSLSAFIVSAMVSTFKKRIDEKINVTEVNEESIEENESNEMPVLQQ